MITIPAPAEKGKIKWTKNVNSFKFSEIYYPTSEHGTLKMFLKVHYRRWYYGGIRTPIKKILEIL